MKQYRASSLILSIIVIAAMLPLTLAARQRAAAMTEEIVGIVTQTSASSLTISTSKGDRVVHVTSATVIRVDGHSASLSAIAVGDKVEAHVQTETDGTSTALVIEAESHPRTEIDGTVHSITATTLTITTSTGDVATTLTADTRFFVNGRTATASDIHAGDHVEVEAQEQTDKTLNALVVNVEIETVHLRGVISKVSPTSITVTTSTGDVAVGITSSTLIRLNDKVADASILATGERVEIDALRNGDQTLSAVIIDVERPDALAEIEGSVTTVASDHIIVHTKSGDDITIGVTTATIIRGDDHMLGLSDIKVGDQVDVEARVNTDGSYTALRIEDEGGGSSHTAVALTGVIASISTGSITVTAGGKSVVVDIAATTAIRRGSTTLTIADLKVGNLVAVTGLLNTDGSVAATLILVAETSTGGGHPEVVIFTGTITAVSATSVTVKAGSTSITVALTSSTVVTDGDHTSSITALKVGQHVEVHANRLSDNSLVATQIRIDH